MFDGFSAKRHLPVKRFASILCHQVIRMADQITDISSPPESIVIQSNKVDISTMDSAERGEINRDETGQSHPKCYLPKKTNRKGKIARMQ